MSSSPVSLWEKRQREKGCTFDSQGEQFVLKYIDRQIDAYEEEKGGYEKEFEKLARKNLEIKHQKSSRYSRIVCRANLSGPEPLWI